jgi:uncharacterized protein DUF4440/uncharacterized protein DUF3471
MNRAFARRATVATVAAVLSFAAARAVAQPAATSRDTSACRSDSMAVTGSRADAEELRGIAQRLLDAIAADDTATWSRYLADDGVFTDEEANVRGRRALLGELRPLPPGFGGFICIAGLRGTIRRDLAVLSYDALETETVYGQVLHTRFHNSDTWVRQNGGWKLLAQHTAVLPGEHTAVVADPSKYADYVGRYELAPGVALTVTREGDRLFAQRGDRPREELLPLGPDRFFRRGATRGERIFRRDSAGRVDALLDRRDNNDLVWRRVR